ncbi:PfaD family polyunsaturated fatty acid/polyketide biosynthesis protein [Leptolyngbya sp. AN03gr2]|uniref:PfaD family polyunsaturated fatty acid/polyketide biosynthesis protein n=1 Tax=Leptolyngbya sp. AN03gr2 TaxID=3423364 RepID=UPI003D319DD2
MTIVSTAPPQNGLQFIGLTDAVHRAPVWQGSLDRLAFEPGEIKAKLLNLEQPCYIVRMNGQIGVTNDGLIGSETASSNQVEALVLLPSFSVQQLGDPTFRAFHRVQYAYQAGAMAGGIASVELVTALGKAGILSSFGAGGLPLARLEQAIVQIQQALPNGLYAFNLIHSPMDTAIEQGAVELYLKHQVRTVEASAFLDLTDHIVRYRVAGLSLNSNHQIEVQNKVIAKVSRREVATKFMQPAPLKLLKELVAQGLITEQQAKLSEYVPMADDLTVEADSGGHTDNRPLSCLLPSLIVLRDELQAKYGYTNSVRVGAAGGIGTPEAVLGAFMMGAAYVVTGSVNQACIESGASFQTKQLLAQAETTDVTMAPAADMFEMGVKLQVLKRGTLFPLRAQKLYELYRSYDSIEAIPIKEREQLEKQIFRRTLDSVWQETTAFFQQRDPEQLARSINHPKRKMALIFRWYLGLSSRWSSIGEAGREIDYQIWCGPAMGAFNEWVNHSYLKEPQHRRVCDVANHLMRGAAFLYRIQNLRTQGLLMAPQYSQYIPTPSKK